MSDLVLILGTRGTGKTYLACQLARAWPYSATWAYNPAADPQLAKFSQWSERRPPPTSNVLLICDEGDRIFPSSGRPLEGWRYDAVDLGRHRAVSLIVTARRPQSLHRSLRTLATRVYLGHLGSRLDLDHAAREWGDSASAAWDLPPRRFVELRP